MAPFIFIRFILGWGSAVYCWLWTNLWTIGIDLKKPIPQWRRNMIIIGCNISGRIILAQMCTFFIKNEKVNYDYKKFLGPNWKPSFD